METLFRFCADLAQTDGARRRARERGLVIGTMQPGPRNAITDVDGVTVGHCTVDTVQFKTGVTVILPCRENPFFHKLPAGVCMFNGFGKTTGLMQIDEVGVIETPIALANTMNVGKVHDALVGYMIERCAADGFHDLRSVNPVVAECCDGTLSDIRARPLEAEQLRAAIAAAGHEFAEGAVGAGRGTVCHGVKGGIGTASRVMEYDGKTYTLGCLVQTNHGLLADLAVDGRPVGNLLAPGQETLPPDKGSVIVVLATDLPLDGRQLRRVARRAAAGLSRAGSYFGQGSGDIFLAFSTANAFDPRADAAVRPVSAFHEERLDLPFRAAAECTEEAVLNSMLTAVSTEGFEGRRVPCLDELLEKLRRGET